MLKKLKLVKKKDDSADLDKCWDSVDDPAEIDDAEYSPEEPLLH